MRDAKSVILRIYHAESHESKSFPGRDLNFVYQFTEMLESPKF